MTNSGLLRVTVINSVILVFTLGIFPTCIYAESNIKIPVYGHWCGPGAPASGNPEPIDEIDAACKKHDLAFGESMWPEAEGSWPADADRELAESMRDFLIESCLPETESQNSSKCQEITTRQFIVANAMLVTFTGAQVITIIPEVVEGKFSSIVKLPLSASTAAITVPVSLTNNLVEKIISESGIPGNDELASLVSQNKLVVEAVIDVSEVAEEAVDYIGDKSQLIVRKLGEETGLDKPLKELEDEIQELLSDTGDIIEDAGQKIIDCVLPWRWKKC